MASGTLRIRSCAARLSAPAADVEITLIGGGLTRTLHTDADGLSAEIEIETPDRSLSLRENSGARPYALCTVCARKAGCRSVTIEDVQIFPGQLTEARMEMIPAGGEADPLPDPAVVIPPHALYAGGGGSGPAPAADAAEPADSAAPGEAAPAQGAAAPGVRVLDRVIVPTRITVHLGKPAASAANVTVGFQEYIANVASSEVYPTWPEEALRANIHAQISLALNRIYTEWYPSRGYSFNITNSTSYDQYFVYNRTVFDVMTRLTADIFNTYVRKTGTVNPYYTEYCDGKSVTCAGMKQWGTVTQAENGKSALQILRSYYGSDIEVVRTSLIQAIPESYPGTPQKQGSTGSAVHVLQRQLNRITRDYPSFGLLQADGVFGPAMAATVKKFQAQFGLAADGIVGRATWYKISFIYVSVKDLAELTSEGETADGALSDGTWGGVVLRAGSAGRAVEQAQYWLSTLAEYYPGLPAVTVDGSFGTATRAAVMAFQEKFGLAVVGVIGQKTWEELYAQYQSIESDLGTPNAYPGTPLRQGACGDSVRLVQFWLRIARTTYTALRDVTADGVFGPATRAAVAAFQSYFGLTADGVVGEKTWNRLYEVYGDIANDLLDADLRPGAYPGVLKNGSTGTAVRELQYYLYLLAAYESSLPAIGIDGVFGAATERAVRAWQTLAGLTADGIVGRKTWDALYAQASRLRLSGPVVTVRRMAWPGQTLKAGDQGSSVQYFSTLLARIAYYFPRVQDAGRTSVYTAALALAARSFQALEGLPETGEADEATWLCAEALSLTLLAGAAPAGETTAGEYPGAAAAVASAGPQVRLLQRWLNAPAVRGAQTPLAESGIFTAAEAACVAAFQRQNGLPACGVAGRETWMRLRAAAGEA